MVHLSHHRDGFFHDFWLGALPLCHAKRTVTTPELPPHLNPEISVPQNSLYKILVGSRRQQDEREVG